MSAMLRHFLGKLIKSGALETIFATGDRATFGDGSPPACAIAFADKGAETALALDPEIALGELYMEGRIRMVRGEIYDLLALAASNLAGGASTRQIAAWQYWRRLALAWRSGVRLQRARANAAHHYDLDARLYKIFLDRELQYSCAYFETADMSLDAAQKAKMRHIAAKLEVEPGQSVLDIGCGWGGLALYLAQFCDAEVLGVTLASQQLQAARQSAESAKLAAKARFALEDYRQVRGRYDRIVSVGMLEHVGPKNYDAFFGCVSDLLVENGVALIHTIGHFSPPAPSNPWVTKYIFPDGHIPALMEIAPAIARAGLLVADLETLRDHYALTVAHWRARFKARRHEARAIYGERFCRMWEFYLAEAECAFRFQRCCVLQFQLVKRFDAAPITRNYIARKEAELRAREAGRQALTHAAE